MRYRHVMNDAPTHRTLTRRSLLTGSIALSLSLAGSMAQESSHGTLISTAEQLQRNLRQSISVRVLDASPLRTYRAAHIPDAIHVFWQDTVDANYPVFGAVVTQGFEQEQRLAVLRRFGVLPTDDIVVYDDVSGFRASRIVWFLALLGFDRVSILDGGLDGWRRAGGSVESGVVDPPAISPIVAPREGYYVVTEALRTRIERADTTVLDIRSASERADTLDGQLPLGTIPTSLSWPWPAVIDPDHGALLAVDQLTVQVADLNLTPARDIVVFGRFGVESALSWLVLRSLGYQRVLTYDRGWVEWAQTPDLPIETLT